MHLQPLRTSDSCLLHLSTNILLLPTGNEGVQCNRVRISLYNAAGSGLLMGSVSLDMWIHPQA